MGPNGAWRPWAACWTRPWVATVLACALVSATVAAELFMRSEASLEVIHVFAVAYVAWSAPRLRHHGPFALGAALAHGTAQSVTAHAGNITLAWNVCAHAVLFAGAAVLVARGRRSMVLLARLANTDDLTGASSRRHFLCMLERELTRAHRAGAPHGVAMIDLDRFREVNNRFGHDRGDVVLARCAAAMIGALRGQGVLGRIGGDEFALLLRCDDEEALALSGRLRAAVLDAAQAEGVEGLLGVSIGIATCHVAGDAVPHRILKRADELLYVAKSMGNSGVAFDAFEGDGPACEAAPRALAEQAAGAGRS